MAGLLGKIKSDVKKAGTNKNKIFYVREGEKKRIRFLQDADDGFEYTFHDSYEAGVNVPCQQHFDKDCPYCDDETMRTRSQYAWSVWDYDAKEVKVFLYPVNNCTPIPALLALYDTYGTMMDRDYVVSVSGKQQNKSYSVVPMDKAKFRNEKAKPFSESAMNKIVQKAYPFDGDDESDDEDEKPTNKKKGCASSKGSSKPKNNDDDDDDGNGSEVDYSELSPKELYKLCKEREIEVEQKKPAKYYIDLLEENDEENAQDDEWPDEEEEQIDYSELEPKELYKLCKERDIEVEAKKPAKYYITRLEEYDAAQDDWGDDGEEDGKDEW